MKVKTRSGRYTVWARKMVAVEFARESAMLVIKQGGRVSGWTQTGTYSTTIRRVPAWMSVSNAYECLLNTKVRTHILR